ncbi:hypothetical protein L873DRAFT_1812095 [Choiromyces venosus 120613-1]|uniref:Signal recognition particle subunit SRP68 n=1 Tax=Choiromyces venosus 120613-1 TaxID=1336337 RepID=A0A3N4JFE2_9PEZI|nr:hypothetical protein L873DRAFT_1812095 [Choiromyces venosus 120613-1]
MEIIPFVSALRQEAQVLGDYHAVRTMCSRRLATLRKRLGRQTSKSKKYAPQPPLTAEEIAQEPKFVHLYLYSSERAWAHAMQMKSLLADDTTAASASMKSHLVSRLHKAQSYAVQLCTLLEDPGSKATDHDILEANAYAASLRGSEAFEKSHWEDSIKAFAISKIIYSALLSSSKNEIYKDQLTSTVDPSIRYSAYQLQLPRNMDVATISRQHFPRKNERVVKAVEALDAKVLSDPAAEAPEEGGAGVAAITSVTWRSRTAPVEDADISVALAAAQAAENSYYSLQKENPSSTEAFDGVLLAWQEAVDASKKAIDERTAEGVTMGDPKMQNLQLTWTVVNYSLICWRIARNRVMIEGIAQGGKRNKKGGEEVRVKKLGHLKEEVALYDAILQSLEQVYNLPGVAADEAFTSELDSKKAYFSALKCSTIARSHAILSNRTNALALFARALSHITSSSPPPTHSAPTSQSHKGLEITPIDSQALKTALENEVARFRALAEMDLIAAKAAKTAGKGAGALVERLDQYPEGKIDFENGIVQWPPKVTPVPVKPVFLDVAFNFIEYPGDGAPRAVTDNKEEGGNEGKGKKGGFLGSLWGR